MSSRCHNNDKDLFVQDCSLVNYLLRFWNCRLVVRIAIIYNYTELKCCCYSYCRSYNYFHVRI